MKPPLLIIIDSSQLSSPPISSADLLYRYSIAKSHDSSPFQIKLTHISSSHTISPLPNVPPPNVNSN